MVMSFLQVHKQFKALAPVSLSSYCIYGGAAYEPQENALQSGIDVLVGTPGRTLDHVTQGSLDLSELRSVGRSESYIYSIVGIFVWCKIWCILDEASR